MDKIFATGLITLSALTLSYFVLKYWNKRLLKDFNTQQMHNAFAVFMVFQFFAIFLGTYLSFDFTVLFNVESMRPFSSSGFSTFWAFLGVFVVGMAFIYFLSVFIALIIYKTAIPASKEFKQELNHGNVPVALVVGALILLICAAFTHFTLRPIITEWVIGKMEYLPLN